MSAERIIFLIKSLEANQQQITAANIIVASLFTGCTLAGQEAKINKVINKFYGIKKTKIDKTYTHFLIEKASKKVVNGWDYKGCDEDEIKHYSKIDMKDNDQKPKDHKVVSKSALKAAGFDPFDSDNWKKY